MQDAGIAVSSRLEQVRYDIRGPLSRRAHELEAAGHRVLRLNIGNPGLFGFRVPQHLRDAISASLPRSEAYCHQQGLAEARLAMAEAGAKPRRRDHSVSNSRHKPLPFKAT